MGFTCHLTRIREFLRGRTVSVCLPLFPPLSGPFPSDVVLRFSFRRTPPRRSPMSSPLRNPAPVSQGTPERAFATSPESPLVHKGVSSNTSRYVFRRHFSAPVLAFCPSTRLLKLVFFRPSLTSLVPSAVRINGIPRFYFSYYCWFVSDYETHGRWLSP